MKKNYLITTGGSGGHVLPATILCEHLSNEANLFITIDKRGLKYLDRDIYSYIIIDTPKLNNIFLLPFNLIIILYLTIKSTNYIKKKSFFNSKSVFFLFKFCLSTISSINLTKP